MRGSPPISKRGWCRGRVHPRACGAAVGRNAPGEGSIPACGAPYFPPAVDVWQQAPSPRVRGSRIGQDVLADRHGSIPTRVGQPHRRREPSARREVHPRAVRGSPGNLIRLIVEQGSIPARTGQPRRSAGRSSGRWVHPRAYGAAAVMIYGMTEGWGPSLRVRGSPTDREPDQYLAGSIPARTGQPGPRHGARLPAGSIPARAGQPMRPARAGHGGQVHPRACGAAV